VNEFILAIDVGAGSLRAGLVRADGRVAASAAIGLAIAEPQTGWAEIDPELWWKALLAAAGRVLPKLPRASAVVAVCICGLTRSQVLLDRQGRALGPAILFRDRRAMEEARALALELPSGNPADAISAFHPIARLAWLAHHRPALYAKLDAVLDPKDFLNLRLTGVRAGDTVTHSRGSPSPVARGASAVIERCLELLRADLRAPWQSVGEVQPTDVPLDRLANVPVFAGSMDTWGSAVGSGAVSPGQAYDVAGTSEAVGLVTERRRAVPGLVALAWTESAHQVGGPTQAGADCAQWCHATFRIQGAVDDAIERVGRAPARANRPIFLPYLAGERTPVWRGDVRGAFHALDRSHGPDDLLWSVLEGVAMAGRDILDHAVAGTGQRVAELRASGGGARSDAWCQIKADILGVPVLRSTEEETGIIGAAIAAAVGVGLYRNVGEAATAMVAIGRRFRPRKQVASLFEARAATYRQIKQAALDLADVAAETGTGVAK